MEGDAKSQGGGTESPAGRVPSASQLDAVLRALPDLYFLLDGERRFIDYSAGHESELYRSPEDFLGKSLEAVLPPTVSAGMVDAIDRAHANDEIVTFDYTLELGGELGWFEVRLAPLPSGLTVALVRNVTERRHAAEALRLQEERLRQSEKLEALGRVAGSIAHDFNNLMTVVSTSCAIADRRLEPDHPAHAALVEASAALRSAADLSRHLLAFASRQAIGMDLLDLDAVIDGMEFILRGLSAGSVAFVRERSATALTIRATRVHLEQVMLNLVVNAVDAMKEGGTLTVRTSLGSSPSEARIEVVDTGVGMSAEVAERALEPFFSTKPQGHGSGLGLATVDSVVRGLEGRVAIQSTPGEGTTISITLPLSS